MDSSIRYEDYPPDPNQSKDAQPAVRPHEKRVHRKRIPFNGIINCVGWLEKALCFKDSRPKHGSKKDQIRIRGLQLKKAAHKPQ